MTEPTLTSVPPKEIALWWQAVLRMVRGAGEKNLSLIAAGVAFYAILAMFPGLAATIALWGLVGDPDVAVNALQEFEALLPNDVYRLLNAQLLKLAQTDGLTLGWTSVVSFGIALWSARSGVDALIRGLNEIYDAPKRSGLWHRLRATFLTFCLIGVLLVALTTLVVLPTVLAFVPLGTWAGLAVEVARWCVGIAVPVAGLALVYRIGPNLAGARPRMIAPGVIFSTIGCLCASAAFSGYLQNFGTYNKVYGSLGAVMVLLMWLYFGAFLVLLGGALNAELARARRALLSIPEPSTTSTP